MAEIPVLEGLAALELFLLQSDDSGRSSDIGGLAILDRTRLALVSATTNSDSEQRLLPQSLGAAAVVGGC
jgi:hypothetical protein